MEKIDARKSQIGSDGLTFKKAAMRTAPCMAAAPSVLSTGGPLSTGWSSVLGGVSAAGGAVEDGDAIDTLRRSVAQLEKRTEEIGKETRRQVDEVLLQQAQLSDKVKPPRTAAKPS